MQRHRSYHPQSRAGSLRMVGHSGFVHIEWQRLPQAEAHNSLGFLMVVRQSLEIQQHHAHGSIRQHRDHIACACADVPQSVLQRANYGAPLPQIALGKVRDHAPRRQFAGRAELQHLSGIRCPPGNYPVRSDFASQLRPARIVCTSHCREILFNQLLAISYQWSVNYSVVSVNRVTKAPRGD